MSSPPARLLKDTLNRVSDLTYFKAAVARADSGQVNLGRLDSLLNYAVTNMTVLAPNDAAFQNLIYGLVYGKVFALTGSAVIADAQAKMCIRDSSASARCYWCTSAVPRSICKLYLRPVSYTHLDVYKRQ